MRGRRLSGPGAVGERGGGGARGKAGRGQEGTRAHRQLFPKGKAESTAISFPGDQKTLASESQ